MKIYLELFYGEIIGWGSNIVGAPEIELPENHDFFTNIRAYKLNASGDGIELK